MDLSSKYFSISSRSNLETALILTFLNKIIVFKSKL